ncbi:Ribosomal RNA small subunit methyltransferase G [Falsiruegeria litorea R37]|uniref:Ribosomal RNA small subunit methyltransferase G n=1 Tax=Falsiruegeria litorea R37 TaxID=1200284 RepID=A0A1Y5TPZ0_9RHOB|nr:16S rRNA (guanine(527)-N(7))-methyltransferase RsmG [Falsiruegeria litorea]SLN69385.1 Ribosomal RNA small subunit methyltransferase G [Falsiruegeria litorea R37]
MKKDAFERATGLNVSRETFKRLETYVALVKKWNPAINVVSRKSLDDIWPRHIVDSVQLFTCIETSKSWLDLGSGGGFPGAVISILANEFSADTSVTLVESDQRKSAFLRNVSRETSSDFRVISKRIEQVEPQHADVISARALTNLSGLMAFCERHLNPAGVAIFPKGATWKKEVSEAQRDWQFEVDTITSITEPQAVILKIKGIERARSVPS